MLLEEHSLTVQRIVHCVKNGVRMYATYCEFMFSGEKSGGAVILAALVACYTGTLMSCNGALWVNMGISIILSIPITIEMKPVLLLVRINVGCVL
jgi:hypothetical protein